MKMQLGCFAGLLLNISIVLSKVVNRPRFSNYHIPWACSAVHTKGSLIGACSIFDTNTVIVAVDNFNQNVKGSNQPYYKVISQVLVFAGTNVMDPERLKPWAGPDYQVIRAVRLLVPNGRSTDGKWEHISFPDTKDLSSNSVVYDHYGAALNVAFLVLKHGFTFNDYVQPILVTTDLPKKTSRYTFYKETATTLPSDTCITYSWSQLKNKMRIHEVTYLNNFNCLDVFCMWNLSTCELFPRQKYQACFKSVTYADVCPNARGAALFCSNFHNSTFGILTTAPSCGRRDMPGVYTTMPTVIALYESIFNTRFDPTSRPKYEPLGLHQNYTPFG